MYEFWGNTNIQSMACRCDAFGAIIRQTSGRVLEMKQILFLKHICNQDFVFKLQDFDFIMINNQYLLMFSICAKCGVAGVCCLCKASLLFPQRIISNTPLLLFIIKSLLPQPPMSTISSLHFLYFPSLFQPLPRKIIFFKKIPLLSQWINPKLKELL